MLRTAVLAGAVAVALATASSAVADPPAGVPGQATFDGGSGPSSLSGGTWSDLPDGVARRPYLKRLTVVNGGSAQTVYTGGPGGTGSTQPGDVTAVVSPINLCGNGQTENCYATPNRVGVTLGYLTGDGGVGTDFADPTVPLRQTVDAGTVLDVVIGLDDIGRPLRWTWANGDLAGWKTSDLGQDDGEIHLRLRPVVTPQIDFGQYPGTGCTATPIFNCEISQASGETLSAGLVLSLDGTLPDALSGAAFATQHAIMGYLQPGGTPDAPVLDLQMSSSHLQADGSPQLGTLQAFLPAAGLQALYGLGPADAATLLGATREGDPGTSAAPELTPVAEDDADSAGLLVTIRDITFSAPTYRIARRSADPTTAAPQGASEPAAAPLAPGLAAPSPPSHTAVAAAQGRCRVATASRTNGLALRVSRARPGRATAALLVGSRTVARGAATVGRGGTATLRIRLGRSARRALRHVQAARVRVVLPGQPAQLLRVRLR